MSTTINLVLWKHRPKKDGTFPIYVRFIKNRKVSYVSTNHSVKLKDWDEGKAKVKASYPNSVRLNAYLRHLESEYSNKVMESDNQELNIGVKSIKRKLLGNDSSNFAETARELATSYKIQGKIGTYAKASSIIKKFVGYMHSENFTFQDIDNKTLNNYQSHIMLRLNNKAATVNKDLKFIKTVFLYAQRMEYIDIGVNPFLNFKFLKIKSERGFLEPEEITLLEKLDCSSSSVLCKAKDTIMFQYYAGGLRISDVLLLKWDNIKENRIHLTIRKTGVQTSHKLSIKALELLKKYRAIGNEFIFGYLENDFDLNNLIQVDNAISRSTSIINKALKRIAKMAGIKKRLSTHLLRHSFATNALQQGMSLEALQSVLKHSNIRETQIYAKILNQKVDAEIDKLIL